MLSRLYHIDSVESTSKLTASFRSKLITYTILTLWSQLQNWGCSALAQQERIPYWLCGVNFKTTMLRAPPRSHIPYWLCGVNFKTRRDPEGAGGGVYHIDSVESTSKPHAAEEARLVLYTILTLWSQLQNRQVVHRQQRQRIPYWLCGVNFKTPEILCRREERYTILTLWSQLQNSQQKWKAP